MPSAGARAPRPPDRARPGRRPRLRRGRRLRAHLETPALGRFSLGYGRLGPTEARLALVVLLVAVGAGARLTFGGLELLDPVSLGAVGAMLVALGLRAAGNLRVLAEREP